MARQNKRNRPQTTPSEPLVERIHDVDLEKELSESYMEYALSVIISRAIPDARDGLKPVQRRILYAMLEAGLRSDRPYRKSIAAVGDTMKKFHPHGDSAIYETLVRMAQDWVMNAPLVDGHGNYGSLDDGPAAARYTEARLSKFAEALLADVDEQTVDFSPNFDASTVEPRVLPAGIPALLVNGASGIAVGMATNIPPHNLSETVAACQVLLKNPDAKLADVMKVLPAPDFPTGGLLVASKTQLREMYQTGRGQVRMRAEATITDVTPRRRGIVVTALPYNTGPEKVINRVKELVAQSKLAGVADVKDLTDRKNGLRLVFEVKSGFDPEAVLSELYRLTPLEESFAMNAVALVGGRPVVADLMTLLKEYIEHRIEVVRRRCQYRLDRAKARMHILRALIAALADIDEVVRIIRSSKDVETARAKLTKRLTVDVEQANHILDMPLRRLTSLEATKLKDEMKDLQSLAKNLEAILKSEKLQRETVSAELGETTARFGSPRRCRVVDPGSIQAPPSVAPATVEQGKRAANKAPSTLAIQTTPAYVGLLADGRLALNPSEPVRLGVSTTTTSDLLAVSSSGRAWHIPVAELPGTPVPVSSFCGADVEVVGLIEAGSPFAMGTEKGVVKRIADESPTPQQLNRAGSDGVVVIALAQDDSVVSAHPCTEESELFFVTRDAQVLRTMAGGVRPQGRQAGGMAGIKLKEGDLVVEFSVCSTNPAEDLLVVSDGLSAKISRVAEYPIQGRATQGVRCMTMKKQDTAIALALVSASPVALDRKSKPVKLPGRATRRDASGQTLDSAPACLLHKRL